MEYETFRSVVREQAELESLAAADDAAAATLVTLSERVPDARDLAEQVPHEVGEQLTATDSYESFGYDEFVARVVEREEIADDRTAAERYAQTVVAVLLDAVDSEDSDDLLSHHRLRGTVLDGRSRGDLGVATSMARQRLAPELESSTT